MIFRCRKARLRGNVPIPGSKSHTIRAVAIAAMADGRSTIEAPLVSGDALSAVKGAEALGAHVERNDDQLWFVDGCAGNPVPAVPAVDIGNSGTSLRILMGLAGLIRDGSITFTGDEQIQRRPAGPLADALNELGASVTSVRGNGCAPFCVKGRLRGGACALRAPTSQYVTSLLMACPLGNGDTTVRVLELNEKPYVQMTLDWLKAQGIKVAYDNMSCFRIPGNQSYRPFHRRIPGDFSSATFFLVSGALPGNRVSCTGLDMADSQADRAVVDYLRQFGARVTVDGDIITVEADRLTGTELDLNETPDALPMLAVLGCCAAGETCLTNVAHARIKETDRIDVMTRELRKMGADIEDHPDGLTIRQSRLRGTVVEGHGDHRVVMALSIAASIADGDTEIRGAEAAGVTFPTFPDLYLSIGGKLSQDVET